MHCCVVRLLAVGLVLTGANLLQAQEAASILEKAIKAHGGEQRLAQLNAARASSKGTLNLEGMMVPFTTESATQLPGQLKTKIQINLQGVQLDIVQVLNGDKGTMTTMGETQEIRGAMLAEMKEALYATRVQSLTPLLQAGAFTLTPAKEIKVAGRPALGVKVASKGYKDLTLYFDKDSGLLVKSERRSLDGRQNEVFAETLFSNYKEVQGLKAAMKVVTFHDGKKFMEGEVTDLKFFDKLPDSDFAQP